MRRKEREITDHELIGKIIADCHCIRLGFYDEGNVYIVPLNFGHIEKEDKHIFYFHGAKEGRKIDLIAKNEPVGFEMDTHYKVNEGPTACNYSARYRSIIGSVMVSFVEDVKEKEEGLQLLMKHNTGKGDWEFTEKMVQSVCVFKLEVTELSCKEHK